MRTSGGGPCPGQDLLKEDSKSKASAGYAFDGVDGGTVGDANWCSQADGESKAIKRKFYGIRYLLTMTGFCFECARNRTERVLRFALAAVLFSLGWFR